MASNFVDNVVNFIVLENTLLIITDALIIHQYLIKFDLNSQVTGFQSQQVNLIPFTSLQQDTSFDW